MGFPEISPELSAWRKSERARLLRERSALAEEVLAGWRGVSDTLWMADRRQGVLRH